jgi:hypothetical protein
MPQFWLMRFTSSLLLIFLAVSPALADEDAEGCKDSPLITRMPGSTLSYCEHEDFDGLDVAAPGPTNRGSTSTSRARSAGGSTVPPRAPAPFKPPVIFRMR